MLTLSPFTSDLAAQIRQNPVEFSKINVFLRSKYIILTLLQNWNASGNNKVVVHVEALNAIHSFCLAFNVMYIATFYYESVEKASCSNKLTARHIFNFFIPFFSEGFFSLYLFNVPNFVNVINSIKKMKTECKYPNKCNNLTSKTKKQQHCIKISFVCENPSDWNGMRV